MNITGYDVWVDDHNIDDDGNVFTLVKFARPGLDPQVGDVMMISDGEVAPRPAKVLERSPDGLLIFSFEEPGVQTAAQG